MNEPYEVFGSNYDDCAGLAHVIMSSCNETLLRNANDGVRTPFLSQEPNWNPNQLNKRIA